MGHLHSAWRTVVHPSGHHGAQHWCWYYRDTESLECNIAQIKKSNKTEAVLHLCSPIILVSHGAVCFAHLMCKLFLLLLAREHCLTQLPLPHPSSDNFLFPNQNGITWETGAEVKEQHLWHSLQILNNTWGVTTLMTVNKAERPENIKWKAQHCSHIGINSMAI